MAEFVLDLNDLPDEESAKSAAEILIQSIVENNVLNKDVGKDFLNKCLRNLENDKASPELKFYTLYIFKFFDSREKTILKIFSLLSGHPLFQHLVDLAKQIDPKKSVNEKGKTFFPGNEQLGTKFMRLLLESLKSWSQRFPANNYKEPTKFKKAVTKLLEQKVTFPSDYIYIILKQNISDKGPGGGPPQRTDPKKVVGKEPSRPTEDQKHLASQINFLYNKIELFIGILEDQKKDTEELQQEINKYDQLFNKQQKRLESLNITELEDNQVVELYSKINSFFLIERQVFKEEILTNNDLKSYCDRILLEFDKNFVTGVENPNRQQKEPTSPVPNKKNSKQSQVIQREQYASRGEQDNQSSKKRPGDNVLQGFFSKMDRSRKDLSPGFSLVKQVIDKQKIDRKASSVRGRSPHGASTAKSQVSQFASRLKSTGIFSKPPNLNPRQKHYDGQVIPKNQQIQSIFYEMKKQQGIKRFKISNFKSRALIYESQFVQIGYKSGCCYNETPQFRQMIEFQLFIGNKSPQLLKNLEITFVGDQKSLVYSNPQRAPDIINAGDQYKFQVIVVPKFQVYSLTTMRFSCTIGNTDIKSACVLPSSVLKFVTYQKIDKRQIAQEQPQLRKIYTSEKFLLCHYFSPRKISNYIQQLVEMTDYSLFSEAGSEVDFVLAGHVILKQKFQGIVKIIIRPDLSCVLQLKTNQQSEIGIKDFQLYLQSLEMVLKEAR